MGIHFNMKQFSVLCILAFGNTATLAQFIGILREYCVETFNPTCRAEEVIIMKHALYGRMKTGHCIKSTENINGCSANELLYFDQKCSGRHACEIFIPDPSLTLKQSCLQGWTSYLEASYVCQKVYKPDKSKCISPERVLVKKRKNYIASMTSVDTSCGTHGSPWILESQLGQTITISLTDFSWNNSSSSGSHQTPHCKMNYGYILDMESDDVIKICGGGKDRQLHLYHSSGHKVQVVLEATVLQQTHFIIGFEALGCPEYKSPEYSWIQHENDSIVIQCEYSDKSWKMRCVDNIWLGIVGECVPPPATKKTAVEERIVKANIQKSSDSQTGFAEVTDNHVTAFGLGCATLIICCAVVFLGLYCTKRYEVKTLHEISNSQRKPALNGTMRSVRASLVYKPVTDQHGTLELPPYSFPIPKEDRHSHLQERMSMSQHDNRDLMMRSLAESDYLAPQSGEVTGGDSSNNSVEYWVLENPAESNGTMSEEMYQSIHLNNSLSSNKV